MHLVMFDIDGTLVDSHRFDADLFVRAVRDELGMQISEDWNAYRHVTDSGILEEIFEERLPPEEWQDAHLRVKNRFAVLVEQYIAGLSGGLPPIPGAPGLVSRLQADPGIVVAFATGGWRETAEMKLRAVGIDHAGLPFASSSDAAARIEIMRLAERQAAALGTVTRRTYFGDAPWDRRASADLGYDFVAVGDRVEHPRRFADLSDHDAVLAALRG